MQNDSTNERSFIERLNETIDQHLSDDQFGVEELARELGESKTQLHRKLQLHFGKSASQLIRETRLKKAKELLGTKEYTVAEVAYQVGFNSPTYFNTCFHEFYGYTPGEVKVRQSLRSGSKQGINSFGAYDMAGNVKEWCWNETKVGRVVRGGAWNDSPYI